MNQLLYDKSGTLVWLFCDVAPFVAIGGAVVFAVFAATWLLLRMKHD